MNADVEQEVDLQQKTPHTHNKMLSKVLNPVLAE